MGGALTGEFYAIACAFLWALSSTLLKSQTHRVGIIVLAAWRTVPGVAVYLGMLLVSGRGNDLLHLPLRSLAFLVASTLLGLGLGDLLYLRSMKLIGLARAMPLSAIYPFLTLILAALFLGEQLHWAIAGGAALVTAGAYLLAFPRGTRRISGRSAQRTDLRGVALALSASICWAISTVILRIGVEGVDLVTANTIRVLLLAIVLFSMVLRQGDLGQLRGYSFRTLGIIFLAGITGTVLSTFAFLSALQRAGAGKTSILTSTSPFFAVPFSLALGEKLTSRTLLGTTLTVIGIWLTI